MNTYETRRTKFAPQRPHRAPWLAICLLAASVSFLAGHVVWQDTHPISSQRSSLAPGLPAFSMKGKHIAARPFIGDENPVADVVASAEPTVVAIDTTIKKTDDTSSRSLGGGLPDLLFSKPGHPLLKDPATIEAHGSGSGIIVRSDGYILTNNHVVKDADDIKITLSDNRVFPAKVVGRDTYTDIAILKVDANDLPVARFGSSQTLRPGDWAIAIGSPLGLNNTVTMGIVSAMGRSLADLNNNVDLIQTDAAINPGNSGGPLLDIDGNVIGINMAIRTDAQNIGFSIPIDVAKESMDAILNHRIILRPYLGVSMIDVDPELASDIGVPYREHGVLVSKVASESPAAQSGISEGDVIEKIDNRPVETGTDVQREVRHQKVGNKISLEVVRAGKARLVNVVLKAFPNNSKDDG